MSNIIIPQFGLIETYKNYEINVTQPEWSGEPVITVSGEKLIMMGTPASHAYAVFARATKTQYDRSAKNKGGGVGAYRDVFDKNEYQNGIALAKRAIDAVIANDEADDGTFIFNSDKNYDYTKAKRAKKRRELLNQLSRDAGWANWSEYETAVKNDMVKLPQN